MSRPDLLARLWVNPVLVVWASLVVITLSLADVFHSGGDIWPGGPFIIMSGALILWFVRVRGAHERAIELVNEEHYEEALPLLRANVRGRSPVVYRAESISAWGLVCHARGEYAQSHSLLGVFVDSGWSHQSTFAAVSLAVHANLAYACVLLGVLDEARERIQAGKRATNTAASQWFVVDAFLLARTEQWEQLITLLHNRPSGLAKQLSGSQLHGLLELLMALALSKVPTTSSYRTIDHARDIDDLLQGAQTGQFDLLASHWPTLETFLRGRALTR